MRITAPMFACPLLRPFEVRGEHRLGVSVASGWTLGGEPLPVTDLWRRFMRASGQDAVLDAGIPKSASEWLLVGHAHSAEPVTELVVGVETGGGYKALSIIGDRVWCSGVPSRPEPFTQMPLDWTYAFGGDGFARNPVGRGFVQGDAEGVALPNVELHGELIGAPGDRPAPAGFGAYGVEWPQRMEGLGTYGRRWFEESYPGFADDIDWRVHNVAPPDQRQEAPFSPGQPFVLHNLVAGRPRVELALPEVCSRAFVYRSEPAEGELPDLEEVELTPRTVWLVPDEEMLVLIATGSCLVASPLMTDVAGLLVGLDWSALPRDVTHWTQALAARLDRTEDGLMRMLDDEPLMPDGMPFPTLEQQTEDLSLPERSERLEQHLYEGAKRRRAEALAAFSEAGLEGAEELFPEPARPGQSSNVPLAEQLKQAKAYAEQQAREVEARREKIREEIRAEMSAAGLDTSFLDDGGEPEPGPPPILASTQIELIEKTLRDAQGADPMTRALEQQLRDPAWHREIIETERRGRESYRLTSHILERPPAALSDDRRQELREQVERAIRDRTSLSEQDLTCADLNELDLSGMDLRGAWLEGAELAKANLSGALLERAVLAKADLSEAVLHRTVLRYANLGRTRLLFTELRDCDLGEAILAHANLRAASFTGCDLHTADLSEAWFEQTAFRGCNLEGLILLETSLRGVEFVESRLAKASFVEVDLNGVSFHRCDLSQAALVTCRGEGVRFDDANLENARFAAGCELNGADFRGANLSRATLRDSVLEGAHFDGADLRGADLSQANCTRTRFVKADMRKVLAAECRLEETLLRGANLMEAVLQGADLRGADLAQTNLFGADLALVRGDDRTTIAGALTTRMRVRPLRKAEPMRGPIDEQ